MRLKAHLGGFAIQVGEGFILDLDLQRFYGRVSWGRGGWEGSVSIAVTTRTGGRSVPRPRKYHTEEERPEGGRQSQRKYYYAHRKTISRQRKKAYKIKQAAMKAGQKEPSAGT
jgi:hypothetical protein